MKSINKLSILGFYLANLILLIFYIYPGSIIKCYLYSDCLRYPFQITKAFYLISGEHFFSFFILSSLGMFAYRKSKKVKFIIIYLFLISIILEFTHITIPFRAFELGDLFGNILGVILAIIIFKIKYKHVQN